MLSAVRALTALGVHGLHRGLVGRYALRTQHWLVHWDFDHVL